MEDFISPEEEFERLHEDEMEYMREMEEESKLSLIIWHLNTYLFLMNLLIFQLL